MCLVPGIGMKSAQITLLLCSSRYILNKLQICSKILLGISRKHPSRILLVQIIPAPDCPSEEATTKRGVWHNLNTQFSRRLQEISLLRLDLKRERRVLHLSRSNRMDFASPTQRPRRTLRQPEITNLALLLQLSHSLNSLLNRHLRIRSVLIIQINPISLQPLKTSLASLLHILRFTAILSLKARFPIIQKTSSEFGAEEDLVAASGLFEPSTDQFFVCEGPVGIGCCPEIETHVGGCCEDCEGFFVGVRFVWEFD